MVEEHLAGGHSAEEVVRIGDTVHRTRGPRSTFTAEILGDQDCVIHGDPGPFTTIFQNGLPVAFIDWPGCTPGSRLDDVGYMAWTWCIQTLGNVPIADQAAHLRELCDGYGDVEPEQLIAAMIRQQTQIVENETANLGDFTLAASRREHATSAITWARSDRALILRHQALLLSAPR